MVPLNFCVPCVLYLRAIAPLAAPSSELEAAPMADTLDTRSPLAEPLVAQGESSLLEESEDTSPTEPHPSIRMEGGEDTRRRESLEAETFDWGSTLDMHMHGKNVAIGVLVTSAVLVLAALIATLS